jgi:lipid-A-disaccharide synthase
MAAGEVSGDHQGAHLARAILKLDPGANLFGTGGEQMRAAGGDVRVQTVRFGCVGIQESLRYVRPLRRVMRELRGIVRSQRPDLAVLIDNEGFNTVLARFLLAQGVPFISYFPPQVWMWGRWRARSIARRATAIISVFSEEAEIYRRHGARVACFGHPLLDVVRPEADWRRVSRELQLDPAAPWIALMPGSRSQEVQALARPMLDAARLLKERHTDLEFVLPLAADYLREEIQAAVQESGMEPHVTILSEYRYACLSRCSLLLTASGTATLEAALLGVPMVAAYRVAPLTAFIAKRLVNVRFIAMPNILLKEAVVPELVQHETTAERFAAESLAILENPECRAAMSRKLVRVRRLLGPEGALEKAASLILAEANRHRADRPAAGTRRAASPLRAPTRGRTAGSDPEPGVGLRTEVPD